MKTGSLNHTKPVFVVLILAWAVFALDYIVPAELNRFGIFPRKSFGLYGIIFSPFLHGNHTHIVSNTIPFLALGMTLFIFYYQKALRVLIFSILISGSLVWIFARPAVHIGLSGVIYAIASFLIFAGFFQKKFLPVVISIAVIILYGGLVYGMVPGSFYISWEGHIAGAIAGYVLASAYYRRKK